jgi:DNA polymerase-3 subunit beta
MEECKMSTVTANKVLLSGQSVKELKKVIKGVKFNKHMQVLNNVKVTLNDDHITVIIHTLDFSITKRIPADVQGSGYFLLPIDEIKNLKGFKNNDIFTIEYDNQKAKINNMSFSTMDVEDYPKNNLDEYELISTVTYDELINIDKALISSSKSESRPVLTGILFRKGEIVSTDSHRLFKTKSQIEYDNDILIPALNVKNLKDHFSKDSQIKVSIHDHYVKFEDEFTTFETRLLEGNFPDVSRLIPFSYDAKTTIEIDNIKEFTNIVTAASNITKKSRNNVIKFDIINGELTISAKESNKEFESKMKLYTYGEDLKISLCGQFLLDALKQVNDNKITIHFYGNMRPFIITGKDESLGLILPVRTV